MPSVSITADSQYSTVNEYLRRGSVRFLLRAGPMTLHGCQGADILGPGLGLALVRRGVPIIVGIPAEGVDAVRNRALGGLPLDRYPADRHRAARA